MTGVLLGREEDVRMQARTEGRPCEGTGRRSPPTSQGERLQAKNEPCLDIHLELLASKMRRNKLLLFQQLSL